MSRVFQPDEIEEIRSDVRRNPGREGVRIVCELHSCEEQDILNVLGLTSWPSKVRNDNKTGEKKTRPYKTFTAEQKRAAVEEVLAGGGTYAQIARKHGCSDVSLAKWVREASGQVKVTKVGGKQAPTAEPKQEKMAPETPAEAVPAVVEPEVKEPPLGVMPAYVWEAKVLQERCRELQAAMLRYAEAGMAIPTEWIKELGMRLGGFEEAV